MSDLIEDVKAGRRITPIVPTKESPRLTIKEIEAFDLSRPSEFFSKKRSIGKAGITAEDISAMLKPMAAQSGKPYTISVSELNKLIVTTKDATLMTEAYPIFEEFAKSVKPSNFPEGN